MKKTQRYLMDVILKIVIAVVVPITLAIVGIYGQTFVAQYNASEQKRERIVRLAEAETSFRRQMFAELFNDYVDQISETDNSIKLDALTTRLELLSSNFSDFLNLRPLFLQLERKIIEVHDVEGSLKPKVTAKSLTSYLQRLESSAKSVVNKQRQKIKQLGKQRTIRIPLEILKKQGDYSWPHDEIMAQLGETNLAKDEEIYNQILNDFSLVSLNGIEYHIEVVASKSNLNVERKQVGISLIVHEKNPSDRDYRNTYISSFRLDSFAFPLENNMILSLNHRAAVVLNNFDDMQLEIGVLIFPNTIGNFEMEPVLYSELNNK